MNNFLETLAVNGHGPAVQAEPVFCEAFEVEKGKLLAIIADERYRAKRYLYRVMTSTNRYHPLAPHLVTWEDGIQEVIQIEQ